MLVVLTGGTGLVGQALIKKLVEKNYVVHLLSRKSQPEDSHSYKTFLWPSVTAELPQAAFPKKTDYGIVYLAGEPVSQWPWTKQVKDKIYSSRVHGTCKLVRTLKKWNQPPQFFLSASAIGIYGEQGNRRLTEISPISKQNLFLQKVCKDWESQALEMTPVCRTLIFRLGTVMSYKKGFLRQQANLPLIPRVLSSKPNWLSWISLEDLSSMLLWAIENRQASGVYHAVSPHPVLLQDFYTTLARQIKIKNICSVPSPLFLMKWAGGEMTKNLLASSRSFPEKALAQGFVFKKAKLAEVLKDEMEKMKK